MSAKSLVDCFEMFADVILRKSQQSLGDIFNMEEQGGVKTREIEIFLGNLSASMPRFFLNAESENRMSDDTVLKLYNHIRHFRADN